MSEAVGTLRISSKNRCIVDKPACLRHTLSVVSECVSMRSTSQRQGKAILITYPASHTSRFHLLMRSFGAALRHGSITGGQESSKVDIFVEGEEMSDNGEGERFS